MNFRVKITKIRNFTIAFCYKYFLKPIYFCLDPEFVHDRMVSFGEFIGKYSITRFKTKILFGFTDKSLEQEIFGIKFKNPVGLSAGFDKDALLTDIIPSVGFGFEEVGSITAFPCKGNPKPRLWRIVESKALLVYYGLKNNGSEEISNRLKNKKFKIPIGTNIAMTNSEKNMDVSVAISDYQKTFSTFYNIGNYFTINISCPNTCGGQPFMEIENLDKLLSVIDKIETTKPIFVKISPDVSFENLDHILDILKKHRVDGIICSNLTKKKDNLKSKITSFPGGVSGKPISKLSDDLISHIYKREGDRFVIIGVGGIFNAKDAYRKIRKGASLVQIISGMIFMGPQLASQINLGISEFLKRDGFTNISQAIGADYK